MSDFELDPMITGLKTIKEPGGLVATMRKILQSTIDPTQLEYLRNTFEEQSLNTVPPVDPKTRGEISRILGLLLGNIPTEGQQYLTKRVR